MKNVVQKGVKAIERLMDAFMPELNLLQKGLLATLAINIASASYIGGGVLLFSTVAGSTENYLLSKVVLAFIWGIGMTFIGLNLLKEKEDD